MCHFVFKQSLREYFKIMKLVREMNVHVRAALWAGDRLSSAMHHWWGRVRTRLWEFLLEPVYESLKKSSFIFLTAHPPCLSAGTPS